MPNAFHFWALALIAIGFVTGAIGCEMDRRASFDDSSFAIEIVVMMLGIGLLGAGLVVGLIGVLWGG